MPASNVRAIDKARSLACDVVILDLEDAVAPDAKAEARDNAVVALQAGGFGSREVVVRINGLDTPWGAEDLASVAGVSPHAVLVPKISRPEDMKAYAAGLAPTTRLWAMMETCRGLLNLDAIAGSGPPLEALVVGSNDLAKEMRCRPGVDRAPLLSALSQTVIAARAHGLAVVDGVYNDIADMEGLERQCLQGLDFGFDGKTLIHPGQIDLANRIFAPDPAAVAWARQVVAAFELPENAAKGVLKLEGRMVERLHLEEALGLIALSDAILAQ
jgi:citrate lyase subunit beta/citryl-CoA lyase